MGHAIRCDICHKWKLEKEAGVIDLREMKRNRWHPDKCDDFGNGNRDSIVCQQCNDIMELWRVQFWDKQKEWYRHEYKRMIRLLRSRLNGDHKNQLSPRDYRTVSRRDRIHEHNEEQLTFW